MNGCHYFITNILQHFHALGVVKILVVIGALAVMLLGVIKIFLNLKDQETGFGPNSLRALGIVLFIPTLIIIPVIVTDFHTDTLAALLGTVAGYILSKGKEDDADKKNKTKK